MDPANPSGQDLPIHVNARMGLNFSSFVFGQSIPIGNTLLGTRPANQTNEALVTQTGTNAM